MGKLPLEASTTMVTKPKGLELTEEEAFSLLNMALTSPQSVDEVAEAAMRKLSEYCISACKQHRNHSEAEILDLQEAKAKLKITGA